MHSCKLFGTTGLAGGFLFTKKAVIFLTALFMTCLAVEPTVRSLFLFAAGGKKTGLKQQICRNGKHQLADDVRRRQYRSND